MGKRRTVFGIHTDLLSHSLAAFLGELAVECIGFGLIFTTLFPATFPAFNVGGADRMWLFAVGLLFANIGCIALLTPNRLRRVTKTVLTVTPEPAQILLWKSE